MNVQPANDQIVVEQIEAGETVAQAHQSLLGCLLVGVSSVLEFFPSPDRFDAWRLKHDTTLTSGPDT